MIKHKHTVVSVKLHTDNFPVYKQSGVIYSTHGHQYIFLVFHLVDMVHRHSSDALKGHMRFSPGEFLGVLYVQVPLLLKII